MFDTLGAWQTIAASRCPGVDAKGGERGRGWRQGSRVRSASGATQAPKPDRRSRRRHVHSLWDAPAVASASSRQHTLLPVPPSYKSLRVPHPMPSPPASKHSSDRPSLVQTPPGLFPASDTQLGNTFCGDARSRSAITVSAALSVLDPEQLEPFLITTTTFPLLPLSQSTSYPLPGQQLGTVTVQLQRTSHDPTIPILTRTS